MNAFELYNEYEQVGSGTESARQQVLFYIWWHSEEILNCWNLDIVFLHNASEQLTHLNNPMQHFFPVCQHLSSVWKYKIVIESWNSKWLHMQHICQTCCFFEPCNIYRPIRSSCKFKISSNSMKNSLNQNWKHSFMV